MDGASVGVAVLVTVGLIVLSLVACFSICCCCCAIPVFKMLWRVVFPKSSSYQGVGSRTSAHEYELVGSSNVESGYQTGVAYAHPVSAPSENEVVMAEAYLVPPLAEVTTVNPAHITNHAESNRVQELQTLTTENKGGGFRDSWVALLFIANIVVVVYLSVQSIYLLKFETDQAPSEKADAEYDFAIVKTIAVFAVLLTIFAAATGSWVLSFLIQHAENLIEIVMWGNIALQTFSAVLCLVTLQLFVALLFGLFAGLSYWYLISVRDRIPVSSTILATACQAVKANYTGLVATAFSALFVQLVWVLLWVVAFMGVMYATSSDPGARSRRLAGPHDGPHHSRLDDDPTNPTGNNDDSDEEQSSLAGLYYFLMFLSLYWGVQVIKAVVQTTVAGTLACWWFQPKREAPVRGSLFRALTTSFGSICLGSLIVAFIQAVREVVNGLRRQAMRGDSRDRSVVTVCLIAVLDMLLSWIEQAVQYFNKYAYCYVAAYGTDFVASGRLVTTLFYNRGWTAIINDDLISRALACGVVALTVANMLCGVLLSFIVYFAMATSIKDMGVIVLIGGLVGAVAGLIVGIVLTNALDSAVAMVYVCFAESPAALQANHPEAYYELRTKWDTMHPNTLSWVAGPDLSPHAHAHSPSVAAAPHYAPHSVYHPPSTSISPMHAPYAPPPSGPGYGGGYGGYHSGGPAVVGGYGAGGYGAAGGGGYTAPPPSHKPVATGYPSHPPAPTAVAQPVPPSHHFQPPPAGGKNLPPSAPPGY